MWATRLPDIPTDYVDSGMVGPTSPVAATPEPSAVLLTGSGLLAFVACIRRRRFV